MHKYAEVSTLTYCDRFNKNYGNYQFNYYKKKKKNRNGWSIKICPMLRWTTIENLI